MKLALVIVLGGICASCSLKIGEVECADTYSLAALNHLPARHFVGDCDLLVCSDKEFYGVVQWSQEIKQFAEKQTDRCFRKAFEDWAFYFKDKAESDYVQSIRSLKAKDMEKLIIH